jgi:hypothetical protein
MNRLIHMELTDRRTLGGRPLFFFTGSSGGIPASAAAATAAAFAFSFSTVFLFLDPFGRPRGLFAERAFGCSLPAIAEELDM